MKVCPSCKGQYDENMKFYRKIQAKGRKGNFYSLTLSKICLDFGG